MKKLLLRIIISCFFIVIFSNKTIEANSFKCFNWFKSILRFKSFLLKKIDFIFTEKLIYEKVTELCNNKEYTIIYLFKFFKYKGYVGYENFFKDNKGCISVLFISNHCRRKDYGRKLLEKAIENLFKEPEIKIIGLNQDPFSRDITDPFYLSLNFKSDFKYGYEKILTRKNWEIYLQNKNNKNVGLFSYLPKL